MCFVCDTKIKFVKVRYVLGAVFQCAKFCVEFVRSTFVRLSFVRWPKAKPHTNAFHMFLSFNLRNFSMLYIFFEAKTKRQHTKMRKANSNFQTHSFVRL